MTDHQPAPNAGLIWGAAIARVAWAVAAGIAIDFAAILILFGSGT